MTQILNCTNHSITPFRSYIHLYILNILPFSFLFPLLTPVTSKGKKCRSKLLLKIKDKSKKKFKRHSQFSKIMGGKGSSPFFLFILGRANNHPQTKVSIPALNQLNKLVLVLVFLSLIFFLISACVGGLESTFTWIHTHNFSIFFLWQTAAQPNCALSK